LNAVKEYDTKIDLKKRVTIRGALYDHYHVTEFDDGRIVLEPRELVVPLELSMRSLTMMDAAMANFKVGKVSDPVDLSTFSNAE
jgi:hypothetical protein